jgi:hypothetical protein
VVAIKGEIIVKIGHFQGIELAVTGRIKGSEYFLRLLVPIKFVADYNRTRSHADY